MGRGTCTGEVQTKMRVLRCLEAAAMVGTVLLSSATVRATRGVLVGID